MGKYAVIGFGNAGFHAVKAIRERDAGSVVDIYSDGDLPPANPMLTTYYVKGTLEYQDIFPHGGLDEIEKTYHVNFHGKKKVIKVDPERLALSFEDGNSAGYDKILIATGASAFLPPAVGARLPGVLTVRTPGDAKRLREILDSRRVGSILVVGASMVGIKIVEIAAARGIGCTLADGAPHLFPLAAFESTAGRIQSFLENRGVKLAFSSMLSNITADGNGLRAVMKDGREFPADLVVICIGTKANTDLVRGTAVPVGRGILVDRKMQTGVPGIYAAGDCAEGFELQSGERRVVGLWANAAYQGRTAGANMAGGCAEFDFTILHNISRFMGMDFIGMGDAARVSPEDEIFEYERGGVYIKAVKEPGGKIKCVNTLGTGRVGGILKSRFMKRLAGAGKIGDDLMECLLTDAGIPLSLINFLGG